MVILKAEEVKQPNIDRIALNIFLKALELIGGSRKLVEYRNLTWLPSLMAASYAIVLHEDGSKTEDEIAEFLGITRNSVRNILRAKTEKILQKISGSNESCKTNIRKRIPSKRRRKNCKWKHRNPTHPNSKRSRSRKKSSGQHREDYTFKTRA